MAKTLLQKTLTGVIWGFVEKFSLEAFGLIQGIILARLLMPSDYGLIAMAGVFIAVSNILVDSGFSSALIRFNKRTSLDYSTVFVINIAISMVVCTILCISAPYIADFYHESILTKIVYVNALLIFLGSFISIQRVKMIAELRFKQKSFMGIVVTIATGITSIIMALIGFGVWSLILPRFLSLFLNLIFYWYYQRWFPGIQFSWQSCKKLFGFGSKLLISSLINTIYSNIYPLIIGKKFSSLSLGYYSKASSYANLPSTTVTDVIGSVSYPVLSEIQGNDNDLIRVYRRMLRVSAFVIFPVMMGLAAVAHPFIITLITIKWESSVIFLQILCFSKMLFPIHALNLQLLKVKGRSDLFLRLEIYKKIIGILILIVSVPFGLIYMCLGSVVSSYLFLIINTYYTGKILSYGFMKQMKELGPSYLYSLSMGCIVYVLVLLMSDCSVYLQLGIGIVVGITYYLIVSFITKSEDLDYLMYLVKARLHNNK